MGPTCRELGTRPYGYAGLFQEFFPLMVVDARSKLVEIHCFKNAPTTADTIELLDDIFTSHGFPKYLISDNATVYTSAQFKEYYTRNAIKQRLIVPNFPQTNGLAERTIQTIKMRLNAMENDPMPMHKKINNILFHYHATLLACGETPAECHLNRQLLTKLDMLKPFHEENTLLQV